MKKLTVTLKDIEGVLHGSATARTNARVSAHYTSDLTLTDGSIVPALVKVKPAVVAGVWEFQVYASDDPAVKAECRGFAVVVEAKVGGTRYGGERTVRRTVKPLQAMASPISLGTLDPAEPLPPQWVSVGELVDDVNAAKVAAQAAEANVGPAAQAAAAPAVAAAQSAQADAAQAAIDAQQAASDAQDAAQLVDAPAGEVVGAYVNPLAGDRSVAPGGSPGATAVNIVQGNPANAAAPDLGGVVVLGGGTDTNNNVAGGDGSVTVGTTTPNAAQSGTGAHYSVVGGYDSVAGGLASICIGFHNYTALGSTHGTISGGSFQKINSGSDYGTIGGGTGNTVSADADGATVGGGQNNTASGAQSVIAGGSTNTASGTRAVIAGGINGVVSGANSGIVGGSGNQNHGDSAFIAGGTNMRLGSATNAAWGTYSYMGAGLLNEIGTTAQAQYSVLGGGRQNSVQKDYGVIPGGRENVVKTRDFGQASGHGAVADKHGQHAQASGYFTTAGDAQTSVMVARRQTTDATPLALLLDGGAWNMDMPLHTTWAFTALIAARRADVDGEGAAFEVKGCISRDAVSAVLVGTPTVASLGVSTAASAWTVAVSPGAGRLNLTVTGEAAKTIRWVARVTVTEVNG